MFNETSLKSFVDFIALEASRARSTSQAKELIANILSESDVFCFPLFGLSEISEPKLSVCEQDVYWVIIESDEQLRLELRCSKNGILITAPLNIVHTEL